MKNTFPGFPPETLRFLRALKRNNDREWFLKNKQVYEESVKTPMTELVLALGREMKRFAPEMMTDPARAIYRIYRDVRFSPNKMPYKTHIAALFYPRGMQKRNCGGVYMPEPEALLAIRGHLASQHQKFRSIIAAPEFRKLFGAMDGEQLTRTPKGFAADHPAADLLRYKQFLAGVSKPPEFAASPRLFATLVQLFSGMMPFVRFLNEPLRGKASLRKL